MTSVGGKIALVCCELYDILVVTFIRIDARTSFFHDCCCRREFHKHSKQQQQSSEKKKKLSAFFINEKRSEMENKAKGFVVLWVKRL